MFKWTIIYLNLKNLRDAFCLLFKKFFSSAFRHFLPYVCSSLTKDLYIFPYLGPGQSSSPHVCHWGLHEVAKPPLSHGRVESGQQFSLEKRQMIMPSYREALAMAFLGRDWDTLSTGANTHFEMKSVRPTVELCSVFSSRHFSGKTPTAVSGARGDPVSCSVDPQSAVPTLPVFICSFYCISACTKYCEQPTGHS